MTIGRGKRLMAWALLVSWFIASHHTFKGVMHADLQAAQLDTLEAVYWIYTLSVFLLITGLLGLDATAKQIIPALKER